MDAAALGGGGNWASFPPQNHSIAGQGGGGVGWQGFAGMGSDAFLALGEKQEMPSGGGMEWMRNFLAAWFALGFNWQSEILMETCVP